MTDYDDGARTRAAIAVQIDRLLDDMLRPGVDREELWPLLYEYAAADRDESRGMVTEGSMTDSAAVAVA